MGEDRYVWAYKTHFYRTQPVFYDWQYTFGFLLSQVLADQFELHGSSASGANLKSVWIDSATLPANDFAAKHLHADLASQAFWLFLSRGLKTSQIISLHRQSPVLQERKPTPAGRLMFSGSENRRFLLLITP